MRPKEFDCPKCGDRSEFSKKYLAPGAIMITEDQGDLGYYRLGMTRPFTGPCIIRTCKNCKFSFEEPPIDGETNDDNENNSQ